MLNSSCFSPSSCSFATMTISLPPNMRYPSSDATPKDIRQYLLHLMVHKHDVDMNSAMETANKWEYGRGSHFRECSESQFNKLFGTLGPYLYRSASEDMARDWHGTLAGSLTVSALLGALFGIPFLFLLAFIFEWNTNSLDEKIVWILLQALCLSGPVIYICNRLEGQHRSRWASGTRGLMASVFSITGISLTWCFALAMQTRR